MSHSNRTLLIVTGVAVVAGASGILGNAVQTSLKTAWGDVKATLTGTQQALQQGQTPTPSNPTAASAPSAPTGNSLVGKTPSQLLALATQQGLTGANDATNPAANPYGIALWAYEHSGDPSGYLQLSQADQITWNSVAIRGH